MGRRYFWRSGASIGGVFACLSLAGVHAQVAAVPVGSPQKAPTPVPIVDERVTTVSPLIISPLAPTPDIGAGAPYFMPDEIKDTHDTAVKQARVARWGLEDMRPPPGSRGAHAPLKEGFSGDFSLEALCDTAKTDQTRLVHTSLVAATATQKALDARREAAAAGQKTSPAIVSTELARQQAVNAFVAAKADADEASARIDDFRNLPRLGLGRDAAPSEVERRSALRKAGYVVGAEEFSDLTVTNIVAHELDGQGGAVLTVSGQINNPRSRTIAAPPLSVSVFDKAGFALLTRQFQAGRRGATIGAGKSLAFTYQLKSVPDFAVGASVTFAPSRQVSSASLQGCQVRPR